MLNYKDNVIFAILWFSIKLNLMSDKEVNELIEKIDAGLKLAEERMLKEKSLRGETIVVYKENEGIHRVPASQILEQYKTMALS